MPLSRGERFFLSSDTELLLKIRRVVPGRLLGAGFCFDFRQWPIASNDLVARWQASRSEAPERRAA